MDSDGGEVGKSTQYVDRKGLGALADEGSAFNHLTHGYVGVEFVEHGFFAQELPHQRGLGPGYAQEPGEGAQEHAKDGLQVEFGVATARPGSHKVVEASPGAESVRQDAVEQRD